MPSTAVPTPSTPRFRAAAERFYSRLDWLESWHTFSFGCHHDPAWMGYGPLRVINDDTIAPGRGFGLHPHRDMEIITVMVAGELCHRDSIGHSERLRAFEVQCMSAGTGVQHSEINESDTPCRLLQIWIEPSRVGLEPGYAQQTFKIASSWTALVDPQGCEGALTIQRPVRLWRARPRAGEVLLLPEQGAELGWWIQMIDGSGTCLAPAKAAGAEAMPLQRGDGLGFQDITNAGEAPGSNPPHFVAGSHGADLLLLALR